MQAKNGAPPATLRVKVLRAFQDHERKIQQKDAILTVPRLFGLELKAANKVEILPEDPPTQQDAQKQEEKPKRDAKAKDKETANAG